ncbi:hypothetical protein pb186bvf_007061 [Paramecium bursaria]
MSSQDIGIKSINEIESPIFSFLSSKKKKPKRSIQIYQFELIGIQTSQKFATYEFKVQGDSKIWFMKIRYSTLDILNEKLQRISSDKLPFPPKKFIGNMCPSHIEMRSKAILNYLNKIGSDQEICQSTAFQTFIQKQKDLSHVVFELDKLDFI